MQNVPQPQPSDDFRRNVADLYGDRDVRRESAQME
jgi:hypothetical protein